MERAGKQGQIRNFRFAQTIISDTIEEIGDSGFADASLIKDLKECSAGLTDQEAFAADGLATIRSMSTAHYTQRSNARVPKYTTANKASLMDRFNKARKERLARRGTQIGDDVIDENGEINLQAEMAEMTRAVEKMKKRLAIRNAGSFRKKRRRSVVEKEEIKAFFRWKWENATGEESDWMGQTNVRKIMMMVEKEYDFKKAKDPNWRPENMPPITADEKAQIGPHKTMEVRDWIGLLWAAGGREGKRKGGEGEREEGRVRALLW